LVWLIGERKGSVVSITRATFVQAKPFCVVLHSGCTGGPTVMIGGPASRIAPKLFNSDQFFRVWVGIVLFGISFDDLRMTARRRGGLKWL
jgi:hypothetical protein